MLRSFRWLAFVSLVCLLTAAPVRGDEKPLTAKQFIDNHKSSHLRYRSTGWLIRNQQPDGGWSFATAHKGFSKPGTNRSRVEATSLAILSMTGLGTTHKTGDERYRHSCAVALAFLARQMKEKDGIVDARGTHGDLNSHALATMVTCDLYGFTKDADLKAVSAGCLKYLVQQQDPKTGGWPRAAGEQPSLATHLWPVLALLSGKMADLDGVSKAEERAMAFIDTQRIGRGPYYADAQKKKSQLATARALACQFILSSKKPAPLGAAVVEYLTGNDRPKHDAEYDYMVTMLLYHHQGATWVKWNQAMKKRAIGSQQKAGPQAGSWYDPKDRLVKQGGQLHQTLMRVRALSVYYHLLPFYFFEQDEEEKDKKSK